MDAEKESTRTTAPGPLQDLARYALLWLPMLIFFPLLAGEMLWFDLYYLSTEWIAGDASPLEWLTQSKQAPGGVRFAPLGFAFLRLGHTLWEYHPLSWRASSLFLHGLNALLIWSLLLRFKTRGAGLAALLFAVHPVFVPILSVSLDQTNMIAVALSLGAFLLMPDADGARGARWGLALALFLAAALTSPIVAGAPLAWVLLQSRDGRSFTKAAVAALPLLIIGLIPWGVNLMLILGDGTPDASPLEVGRTLLFFPAKLLLPLSLTEVYSLSGGMLVDLLGWALTLGCVAAIWKFRPQISASLAAYAALLIPMALMGLPQTPFARVLDLSNLYFAALPLLILFAGGIVTVSRGRLTSRGARAIGLIIVVLLGGFTFFSSRDQLTWREVTLRNLHITPTTDTMHVGLNPTPLILEVQQELERFERFYAEAEDIESVQWLDHATIGYLMKLRGSANTAAEEFQKAIDLKPDHPLGYYHLASLSLQRGNSQEVQERALELIDKAYALDPDAAWVLALKASIEFTRRNYEKATELFEKALAIEPENFSLRKRYAGTIYNLGERERGFAMFEELREIQPDDINVLQSIAGAYMDQLKFDEAREILKRMIELEPGPRWMVQTGLTYAMEENLPEAAKWYKQALETSPDNLEILYRLGNAYATMDRNAEAQPYYERAVELNPSYALATKELAVVYARKKDFPRAIEMMERARSFGPQPQSEAQTLSDLYNSYGVELANARRFEESLIPFQKALGLNPQNQSAKQNLALSQNELAKLRGQGPPTPVGP